MAIIRYHCIDGACHRAPQNAKASQSLHTCEASCARTLTAENFPAQHIRARVTEADLPQNRIIELSATDSKWREHSAFFEHHLHDQDIERDVNMGKRQENVMEDDDTGDIIGQLTADVTDALKRGTASQRTEEAEKPVDEVTKFTNSLQKMEITAEHTEKAEKQAQKQHLAKEAAESKRQRKQHKAAKEKRYKALFKVQLQRSVVMNDLNAMTDDDGQWIGSVDERERPCCKLPRPYGCDCSTS